MLLIPEKRVVFYTPPKCSSTTVIKALTEQANAQLVHGPQGPWKVAGVDFQDSVGKHSVCVPWNVKNWKKYIFYRNPFDRFVSLWKHYVKHTTNDVGFEAFIDMVEGMVGYPQHWFYTWRMSDIINEAPKDAGIIQHNDLGMINKILESDYTFPIMNATVHNDWFTYYTPEFYRRVYDLA